MKTKKEIIQVIKNCSIPFELAGFLIGSSNRNELSDIDVFFLDRNIKPSKYFENCERVCQDLIHKVQDIFLFSSFKQQVLLGQLTKNSTPVHFLQYLSANHLVIREVNTLPKFIEDCIETIVITDGVFSKIKNSYNNRQNLLNPEIIRIFYYFDILNEVTPLIYNSYSKSLPFEVVRNEVLHKLKFISTHLGFELLSHSTDIPEESISLNEIELLLKENNLDYLTNQKDEILSIIKEDKKLTISDLERMIKSTYQLFDQVDIITKAL